MADNSEKSPNNKDDIDSLFDTIRESFAKDMGKDATDEKKTSGGKSLAPGEDPFAISDSENADLKEKLALEAYQQMRDGAEGKLDIEQSQANIRTEVQGEDQAQSESAPQLSDKLGKDLGLVRAVVLEDYSDEQLYRERDEDKQQKRRWFFALIVGAIVIVLVSVASVLLLTNKMILRNEVGGEVLSTQTPYGLGPIPASLELPGGWAFELRKGDVNPDGRWVPFGGEWLTGTEVCKWVALPWSIQLEAVIRTLREGDEIQLRMTNYDVLIYEVDEVILVDDDVTPADLNRDVPSIVVLLAHSESDQQWALIGILKHAE